MDFVFIRTGSYRWNLESRRSKILPLQSWIRRVCVNIRGNASISSRSNIEVVHRLLIRFAIRKADMCFLSSLWCHRRGINLPSLLPVSLRVGLPSSEAMSDQIRHTSVHVWALGTLARTRRSVPECLRNKEKQQNKTEPNNYSNHPGVISDIQSRREMRQAYQKTQRHPRFSMIAALTNGTRFLPPRRRRVYMPTRYARSCRKKISAMVAEGRHSTGLTAIPWKMRARTKLG